MTYSSETIFQMFIETFTKRFCGYSHSEAYRIWHTQWKNLTKIMIGDGKTRKLGDYGVMGEVARLCGIDRHKIWAEDFRIDQTWVTNPSEADSEIDVAIEHENDPRNTEEPIRRLCYVVARVKLAILYPDSEDHEQKEAEATRLISSVIASRKFDPIQEDFAVFLGYFPKSEQEPFWHYKRFDRKGSVIKTLTST